MRRMLEPTSRTVEAPTGTRDLLPQDEMGRSERITRFLARAGNNTSVLVPENDRALPARTRREKRLPYLQMIIPFLVVTVVIFLVLLTVLFFDFFDLLPHR